MNGNGVSRPGPGACYELRVAGHLDDHWAGWLGGLALARQSNGTSTLTGPVADQAQLHGVLGRLRDLGVTLLSLRVVSGTAAECEPGAPAAP